MSEPYDDDRDDASYANRVCDDDCRGANRCGGHVVCPHCGDVVCGCEADPDTGLCGACYESRTGCENCGKDFFPGEGAEYRASDGTLLCSQECLDDWESGLGSGREGSNETREETR